MLARFILVLFVLMSAPGCSDKTEEKTIAPAPVLTKVDGKAVYDAYCGTCHDAGPGHPGTMRLALRLGEDKSVLTQRDDLNKQYVKTIVRQGIMLMPPFRPSEVSDNELDALADFLANAKPGG